MTRVFAVVLGIVVLLLVAVLFREGGYGDGAKRSDELEDRAAGEPVAPSLEAAAEEDPKDSIAPARARADTPIAGALPEFAEIRGVVVDASGAPAPDAVVRFEIADERRIDGTVGAAGDFVIREIPPNRYGEVVASGERSIVRVPIDMLQVGDVADLGVLRLERAARVFGQVVTAEGAPVAGARLTLERTDERTESDTLGRFEFSRVVAGKHAIAATEPGFSDRGGVEFDVAGDRDAIELRIEMDAVAPRDGRVTNRDGEPIAGAEIEAYGRRRADPAAWLARTESDRDGGYRFTTLPRDALRLVCGAPGYRSRAVEVAADEAMPTIVLDPGARVTGRAFDAATNAGVELEEILVFLADDEVQRERRFHRLPTSTFGPDGTFECRLEPPRREVSLFLLARARSGAIGRSEPFLLADTGDRSEPIFVPIAIASPATIRATVIAGADAAPVAGPVVELVGPPTSSDAAYGFYRPVEQRVRCDPAGEARLLDVPLGPWRVVARASGFAPTVVEIAIGASVEHRVVLEMVRGGTIECRVEDEAGAAVPAVEVSARGHHSFAISRFSDARGELRFEHVVPGEYALHASQGDEVDSAFVVARSREYDVDEFPHVVADGETLRVVLRVPRGAPGSLEGTITVDGAPLAAARVFAHSVAGNPSEPWIDVLEAATDATGRYRFARLLADSYYLTIVPDDDHEYSGGAAAVLANGSTGHSIAIETGTVAGVVREAGTGAAVAGATVIAVPTPDDPALRVLGYTRTSAVTDELGRFTLERQQRGRYDLLVRRPGRPEERRTGAAAPGDGIEIVVP